MSKPFAFLLCPLVLIGTALKAAPEPTLADYPGDRKGALSFTFDDGFRHQVNNTLEIIEPLGIRGTFFLIPNLMDGPNQRAETITYEEARKLIAQGHEVGTHGTIGARLQDASEAVVRENVNGGWKLLKENTGVAPVSYAEPGGSNVVRRFPEVVRERHFFMRSGSHLPRAQMIGYGNTDRRTWTDEGARARIENLIEEGGWAIPIVHAIVEGWSPFKSKDEFRIHCEWIKSREADLWIAPMGEVGRYVFQREAAELTVHAQDNHSTVFSLSHSLQPKSVFNMPMTVVIPVQGVSEATARTQNDGPVLPVSIAPNKILVEVPVDGNPVRVQWR